jgi:hypothetical protein
MKWLPSPRPKRRTLLGVYLLPMTSDLPAPSTTSLVTVLRLLIVMMR